MFHLEQVQSSLKQLQLDGWLLYDFRRSNDLACHFLEIPAINILTRRFFYWIPAVGNPVQIVHRIERGVLSHLPGECYSYTTWQELEGVLGNLLKGKKQIAMEYSPRGALPTVSKIDGGTLELVREQGVEVMSSANLLQQFTTVWSQEQYQTHIKAAERLDQIAELTWRWIASCLQSGVMVDESAVQSFILKEIEVDYCMEGLPICAVNEHSSDPHYSPMPSKSKKIQSEDFILIDLWCKKNCPQAVYADITRVAVAASVPTSRQIEIFSIVKRAQEETFIWIADCYKKGKEIKGWEADQKCREVIIHAGYGEFFIHRTGHNIGCQDHGHGANLDNLETRDERLLLPGTCFSIEPGIYLPGEFGVRLEYDVYLDPSGEARIHGGIQKEIVCLL